MRISVLPWISPLVAATCIAASPTVVPAVPHTDVQAHPVVLTSAAAPDLLELLGAEQLPDAVIGDAAGELLGLGYIVASLMSVFNNVVSLLLTPIGWIPLIGTVATSLIWTPINLVEQLIWAVFVGGVYSPYYPYFAEATDFNVPAELANVPLPADFSLPDTMPNIDELGLDGVPDLGEVGGAIQDVGAALLSLLP